MLLFFCSNLSSSRGVVVDRDLREDTLEEDLITVDHFALMFSKNQSKVDRSLIEVMPLLHKSYAKSKIQENLS